MHILSIKGATEMAYDPRAVANAFLDVAWDDGKTISPMKLQKLVYFAHGWHLVLRGIPLIDEHVEAWQYGPVIPSIYHEFKHYGRGPITQHAKSSVELGSGEFCIVPYCLPEDDDFLSELISTIWKGYGGFSAIQLSNMTHEPGTPWDQTWNCADGIKTDIPNETIRDYFKAQAQGSRK